MTVRIRAAVCPIAEAPGEIGALADYWQQLCAGRKYPARRDVNPAELRNYLGLLCIIEVRDNPAGFFYLLFGSAVTDLLGQDLTGKSIHDLPSTEFGPSFFSQLEYTVSVGAPCCFRLDVAKDFPPRKSCLHRLVLPLSSDGETIDRILTYILPDGELAAFQPLLSN